MSRATLSVITQWNSIDHGFSKDEIHLINYLSTKYMFHYCISYSEYKSRYIIKFKSHDKYKIVLSKGMYLYRDRYFPIIHYGLIFFQRRIRHYLLKRKYFKNLLRYKLVNSLKRYLYSPCDLLSKKSVFQIGGPMYREIQKQYEN